MSTAEALQFLAAEGVTPLRPGWWQQNGAEVSSNDIAHEMTSVLLDENEGEAEANGENGENEENNESKTDGESKTDPAQRLSIAFGLIDLLDEWWVTVEIGWFLARQDDPAITAAFWDGYRELLERVEPCEPVLYSLWVDWFEDHQTAATAFAEVLGNDAGRLAEDGPMRRRAARVLENSGPVPWAVKHDVYLAAKAVPELHPALFRAVLLSHHDYFGDLEPAAALALLDSLPPRLEGLATLKADLLEIL